MKFKTAFFASVETGVKWKLNEVLSLYTGVYADYGLNDMRKSGNEPLVAYNNADPRDFKVNGVLYSQYAQNGTPQSFTDKVTPLAAGVKLGLAFGTGKKAKRTLRIKDDSAAEAQRLAAEKAEREEAARRLAEAERAEAERLAKEKQAREAQRLAAERAERDETARRQAEAAKIQAVKASIREPVENYKLSQTELTSEQKRGLDEKIALLQQNPDMEAFIYGHTCDIGSDEVNERIGLERARNAKEYLISKGISASRIVGIASKRDTEPLVPNINEENRRKNRRVEIIVN
jgi:outer membrane protein OmpA-like peptidoglycan-associated protein